MLSEKYMNTIKNACIFSEIGLLSHQSEQNPYIYVHAFASIVSHNAMLSYVDVVIFAKPLLPN
jgi:hypothetical protein